MTAVSIDELAKQFEGRKFGELVLHHIDKQSFNQIVAGMLGTIKGLPASIQGEIERLIDSANSLAFEKDSGSDDCGRILRFLTSMVERELNKKGVCPSEDNLFDVFNIIVMNYAYSAHKDPRMKKFIKGCVSKGLFAKLFG